MTAELEVPAMVSSQNNKAKELFTHQNAFRELRESSKRNLKMLTFGVEIRKGIL